MHQMKVARAEFTTSVRLDPADTVELSKIANRWRRSTSEIMRSVVRNFLASCNECGRGKHATELEALANHINEDTRHFLSDGVLSGPEKDHLTDHGLEYTSKVRTA